MSIAARQDGFASLAMTNLGYLAAGNRSEHASICRELTQAMDANRRFTLNA